MVVGSLRVYNMHHLRRLYGTDLKPSLISSSFQSGPTIFHKCNFLKHTPFSKNLFGLIASLQLRLMMSNIQPNGPAKPNRGKRQKNTKRGVEGGMGSGELQYVAALQSHEGVA